MIGRDFENKFYSLWFEDQSEKERQIKWLRSKRPTQTPEEYLEYLWLVSSISNPSVLEIGVKNGHQRKFYEQLLNCRHYEGLDIKTSVVVDNRRVDIPATIVGDSCDPQIIQRLREMEPDGWDIIFVDGAHSREAARLDYDNYKGLVRPGGFLAFHDTHHSHATYCDGAAVLWKEIENKYEETWDIYHEVDYIGTAESDRSVQKQCGIGVIRIP